MGLIILIKSSWSQNQTGTRSRNTIKGKSLHNNKRRCYIRNKRFRLATAKFCKKINNSVSFPEAVLHVVFLENLEHVLAITHDRLGEPIITTWPREKGNDLSSIDINNKLRNVEVFGYSNAISQSPKLSQKAIWGTNESRKTSNPRTIRVSYKSTLTCTVWG